MVVPGGPALEDDEKEHVERPRKGTLVALNASVSSDTDSITDDDSHPSRHPYRSSPPEVNWGVDFGGAGELGGARCAMHLLAAAWRRCQSVPRRSALPRLFHSYHHLPRHSPRFNAPRARPQPAHSQSESLPLHVACLFH
jgi:hypothetical protein